VAESGCVSGTDMVSVGGRHTISNAGDSIGASAWGFLSAMIFSLLLNAFK